MVMPGFSAEASLSSRNGEQFVFASEKLNQSSGETVYLAQIASQILAPEPGDWKVIDITKFCRKESKCRLDPRTGGTKCNCEVACPWGSYMIYGRRCAQYM